MLCSGVIQRTLLSLFPLSLAMATSHRSRYSPDSQSFSRAQSGDQRSLPIAIWQSNENISVVLPCILVWKAAEGRRKYRRFLLVLFLLCVCLRVEEMEEKRFLCLFRYVFQSFLYRSFICHLHNLLFLPPSV